MEYFYLLRAGKTFVAHVRYIPASTSAFTKNIPNFQTFETRHCAISDSASLYQPTSNWTIAHFYLVENSNMNLSLVDPFILAQDYPESLTGKLSTDANQWEDCC